MSLMCPKCGNSVKFGLGVRVLCVIDGDENIEEVRDDYFWDDNSDITCYVCGYDAELKEFRSSDGIS